MAKLSRIKQSASDKALNPSQEDKPLMHFRLRAGVHADGTGVYEQGDIVSSTIDLHRRDPERWDIVYDKAAALADKAAREAAFAAEQSAQAAPEPEPVAVADEFEE